MPQDGPWRHRLVQLFCILSSLDSLSLGLWALIWPVQLYELFGVGPEFSPDGLLLWRALGAVFLGHAAIAMILARESRWWGLAVVLALGRLLACVGWLGLLGTDRVQLNPNPLRLLAAHEAFWLVAWVGYLLISWRRGQQTGRKR